MLSQTDTISALPPGLLATTAGGASHEVCLQVCDYGDPDRVEVEAFIREVFGTVYGARVSTFMPRLLAFRDGRGRLLAAIGLRQAGGRALFLEHYLDRPVEEHIAEGAGAEVVRGTVVEIGNLALASPGYARTVIMAVTAFLCGAGHQWVTFTAVTALRNAFHRMGLAPIHLADADPARLGREAENWGRYYDARPAVFAGSVLQGVAQLEMRMRLPAFADQRQLWLDACVAGMYRP